MRHFQIIVDENMPRRFTLMLRPWVSAGQIGYEVGRKGIQDDEIIPRILLEVKRTTFLRAGQAYLSARTSTFWILFGDCP